VIARFAVRVSAPAWQSLVAWAAIAFAVASACNEDATSRPLAHDGRAVGSERVPEPSAAPTAPPRELCDLPQEAGLAALAEALVNRVNQVRAAGADCGSFGHMAKAAPLRASAALSCSARLHSEDMALRGYFSHRNPDGQEPQARARAAGFRSAASENIAWGQATPEEVVAAWLRSPDHCKTMLDPRWSLTGAAHRRTEAGRTFWTQAFGAE
jgi:uncharacterized protein YkwD